MSKDVDPDNFSITLSVLARAADYTGKHFEINIVN
jgi:hypothetical protein